VNYRELVDWCREKIEFKRRWSASEKYLTGYEEAMRAVMSKLHDLEKKEKGEKNNG
jgi:hypothetical protein